MENEGLQKKRKKQLRVKVYLTEKLFAEITEQAEKLSFRKKGLLLYTQKKHGWADEKLANTDGLAKFLKYCYTYWRDAEAKRLFEAAEIAQQEKALAEKKAKLGLNQV
jgi:hypothetical protein